MKQAGPEDMHRMAGKEKVMAVLMGAVEVRQTFRDWPAEMCLAVCLMESGDCQLIVFRQEELEVLPRRLQTHLGLRPDELCFFPAMPGYPTRALLYSDEQRLIALVAEAPEIVEEASDYAVNYAYALEEGLDPAVFLGIEMAGARKGPDQDVPEAAFVSRRAKPAVPPVVTKRAGRVRKALLPGFMQRAEQTLPGPRFRSARELAVTEERPALCEVRPEQDGWIVIAQSDAGGADIRIGDPELIYLRDDFSVVAIRLEPPWDMSAALPGRIWIRAKSLPPSLRAVFADCAGPAELTGSGAFLYLHIRPLLAAAAPAEPTVPAAMAPDRAVAAPVAAPAPVAETTAAAVAAPRRPGTMRRRLLALTGMAAALVLLQIGFHLGWQGEPGSGAPDSTIDWDMFRSAWQAARAG